MTSEALLHMIVFQFFLDHLLCHDDKCEDRRIAFILYLNENWLSEFGGVLELFSTDGKYILHYNKKITDNVCKTIK